MKNVDQIQFSETHHAILYALTAREVINRLGQELGRQYIKKIIRLYGEQRGGRMALRAKADNQELSMENFLVYGEWRATNQAKVQQEDIKVGSDIHVKVHLCPWNEAWTNNNLIDYGKLYCQEIDRSLVRGFNPDLRIDVYKTLSNDGEPCKFIFHNAILNPSNNTDPENTVMPWDYHCGHLFNIFSEVLHKECGLEGQEIVQSALNEFNSIYGEAAKQKILDFQTEDFRKLPPKKPK